MRIVRSRAMPGQLLGRVRDGALDPRMHILHHVSHLRLSRQRSGAHWHTRPEPAETQLDMRPQHKPELQFQKENTEHTMTIS